MSINDTYTKLLAIVRASSGITMARSELVGSLNNDADLPLALLKVGPATWNEHAQGLYRQQRTYTITVYVKPVAEGVSPDEGYKRCLPVLNALGDTLVRNPTLDDTVDHIGSERHGGFFEDSGVRGDLMIGGTAYHGFTLTVNVVEKTT